MKRQKAQVVTATPDQLRDELKDIERHIDDCCMGKECPQVERINDILFLLRGDTQ